MKKKKILIIDDDEMTRILFRDIFWIHGARQATFDVTAVDSLRKAREALKEPELPDVIFLDLSFTPGRRILRDAEPAVTFIKEVRSDQKLAHIPIVVFSGFDERELKEVVQGAGANRYLVKGEQTPKELVDFVLAL